jgi:uncharacterized protein YndB with AHSA1/START domain
MSIATKTITVEYDLPFPPAKVWRVLTEPKLLEGWLMPNDIAPVVAHKFTMRTQPMGSWDGVVHCEVLTVEPPRRLVYSWKGGARDNPAYGQPLDTVLTFTLQEKPGGTLLLLEHSGFTDQNEFAFTAMSSGWRSHGGARLKQVLENLTG